MTTNDDAPEDMVYDGNGNIDQALHTGVDVL
jgi:hypothetical protein